MTLELIDSSAKVLAAMRGFPNGHMVVLHNAATDAVTFLGRK